MVHDSTQGKKWIHSIVDMSSTEVFCTLVLFGSLEHSTNFLWALSDQKSMSYLAEKESLTKRAYTEHKNSPICLKPLYLFTMYSFQINLNGRVKLQEESINSQAELASKIKVKGLYTNSYVFFVVGIDISG
jgi:hypothetical protein